MKGANGRARQFGGRDQRQIVKPGHTTRGITLKCFPLLPSDDRSADFTAYRAGTCCARAMSLAFMGLRFHSQSPFNFCAGPRT